MFATLKHISSFKKVHYYSVVLDGSDKSLFETFIETFLTNDAAEDARVILYWLKEIGNNRGAKSRYFRHEGSAVALPPSAKIIGSEGSALRLYCTVINENHVVLFSGGIKTHRYAQNCPNVKFHFELAQKLSKTITDNIVQRMIIIPENQSEILIDQDLELTIK